MAYQVCSYCIMDNQGDNTIVFDANGQCDYCRRALQWKEKLYFPNEAGAVKLRELIAKIKEECADKEYDCIIGMSGGLDSSYLAYLAAEVWKLRVIAVHIDDGFDERLAVDNIRGICDRAAIELRIIKPDAEQFKALTRAYFMAGVPNLAVPQDNILFAALYGYAHRSGIKYVLSGSNFALESIIQRGNTHTAYDLHNIRNINRKNGNHDISKLEFISMKTLRGYLSGEGGLSVVAPLNYIEYDRTSAIRDLEEYCGFTYYKSKHLENKLTKFLQVYYLYNKFGVDKRKSHLSSMIVSGQITREEALAQTKLPLYDEEDMAKTIDEVITKLGISKEEFHRKMSEAPRQHRDYGISFHERILHVVRRLLREWRKVRSNAGGSGRSIAR